MSEIEPRPDADNHPGGPLSRAESVLLSHIKKQVLRVRQDTAHLGQILGAIPGNQGIEKARREVLRATDHMLERLSNRKTGATPTCNECHAPRADAADLARAHDKTLPDEVQYWELALCWAHMTEGSHCAAREPKK